MSNTFALHIKLACYTLLLISNIAYSQPKIVCDNISLYTIKQIDQQFSAIKNNREIYLNTLSEKDFIHQVTDSRSKEYRQLFDSCVGPILENTHLEKTDATLLDELFRVTHEIVSYSSLARHAEALHSIFDAKAKSKEDGVPDNWIATVDKTFIRARLFEHAKKFRKRFPQHSFEQLPQYKNNSRKNISRSLMSLQNSGKELIRTSFGFSQEGYIIVIGHPFCHFSQNAISFINTDPALNSIFTHSSTWIMPAGDALNVESVLKTNSESSIKYHYVYREAEWPEIDYWGTPAFYFYKSGRLLRKIVGWPQEGRRQEILEALRLTGLTTPSTKDGTSPD